MKYNFFISTQLKTYSLLDLTEEQIVKILKAYKGSDEYFFINGKKHYTGDLIEFQIYEFEKSHFKDGQQLFQYCKDNRELKSSFTGDDYVPPDILKIIGKNITDIFITDDELESLESQTNDSDYVDKKRIQELEKIKSKNFDFLRLVAILKELNTAYKNKMIFAIPPLVRSIIDQVPPIFDKSNFSEVSGNFGSKSFRDSMNILDKTSRKIADSYLHTKIRKNESSLPTETQINFKHALDVLLQEILRIVRSE